MEGGVNPMLLMEKSGRSVLDLIEERLNANGFGLPNIFPAANILKVCKINGKFNFTEIIANTFISK
jgi:hypothetical protein